MKSFSYFCYSECSEVGNNPIDVTPAAIIRSVGDFMAPSTSHGHYGQYVNTLNFYWNHQMYQSNGHTSHSIVEKK